MSRYFVENEKAVKIVVGWDNPLETFFCQVYRDRVDDDDEMLVWGGNTPGEIATVDSLQEMLHDWTEIPYDIREKLERDYANRTEPTPLQKMAQRLFGNL